MEGQHTKNVGLCETRSVDATHVPKHNDVAVRCKKGNWNIGDNHVHVSDDDRP